MLFDDSPKRVLRHDIFGRTHHEYERGGGMSVIEFPAPPMLKA
jgi:hypothetical protein